MLLSTLACADTAVGVDQGLALETAQESTAFCPRYICHGYGGVYLGLPRFEVMSSDGVWTDVPDGADISGWEAHGVGSLVLDPTWGGGAMVILESPNPIRERDVSWTAACSSLDGLVESR